MSEHRHHNEDDTGTDAPVERPADWHRVAGLDELPSGRVKTVTVGHTSLCLSNVNGDYGALSNSCPHQGGPLGEGSIEKGWLRCPWHGYDYDPLTGKPPEGFSDAPRLFRRRGPRRRRLRRATGRGADAAATVSDVMVETMVNWGVDAVFGMVGHSNLGFADAMRRAEDSAAICATSGSVTKARPPSLPPHTAS